MHKLNFITLRLLLFTVTVVLILMITIVTLTSLLSPAQKTEPIQSQAATATTSDVNSLLTDPRFGYGGGLDGSQILGLRSGRGWGHSFNSLEKTFLQNGVATFFLVGKVDDVHYNNRNSNVWDGHPKCKQSSASSGIVNCIDVPTTGIPNDESYDSIASLAQEFKGQIWEISNEPDNYPYIIPEDYAVWLYLFQKEIKRADPAAKIMNGGLYSCCGYLVYENTIVPTGSKIRQLDPTYANSGDRFSWIWRFRERYKALYGDYPNINIWNIHPYEFANYGESFNPVSKSDNVTRYISEFKTYLNNLPRTANISETNKPVYLTEIGILGREGTIATGVACTSHGCLSQQQQEYEWSQVSQFMDRLTTWLTQQSYIQKWFWYYWGPEYSWAGTNNGSVINTLNSAKLSFLQDADVPDTLAIDYARKAGSPIFINPSFEAHTVNLLPYAWNFWAGGPGSDYWIRVESTNRISGNRSAHLHIGQTAGSSGYIATVYQIITTTYYSGKNLKLSAFCQTGSAGQAGLAIIITNSAGFRNINWTPSIVSPRSCPAWTKLETPVVTVPADTIRIEFVGVATGVNADVWLDDFQVTFADSAPSPTPSRSPTPSTTPTPTPTGAPTSQAPIGWFDSAVGADSCKLQGWTCDPDRYNQPIWVHLYADGPADGTGTFAGEFLANTIREPAVAANCGGFPIHGFAQTLPNNSIYRDGKPHSWYVYTIGIDSSGAFAGPNPLLSGSPKSMTCFASTLTPTPTQIPCQTPPDAPTTVSCSTNRSDGVQVTWDDTSNNEQGFKVVRDTFGNVMGTVGPNITTLLVDPSVACGVEHGYTVIPYNSCGENRNAPVCQGTRVCVATTPTRTPTPSRTPTPTPPGTAQQRCELGGFKWILFPNSCVDSCRILTPPPPVCLPALTWGCDCGINNCWDGITCVNNITSNTPTPSRTPTPTRSPTPSRTPTPTRQPSNTPVPGCPKKSLGDANCDGRISVSDFESWRQEFTGSASTKTSDFNSSGKVTVADFEIWRATFTSQIP